MKEFILFSLISSVLGCEIFQNLQPLSKESRNQVYINVTDTDKHGKLISKIDVANSSGGVNFITPDNNDYVEFKINKNILEIYLTEMFERYEEIDIERISTIGELLVNCNGGKSSIKLELFLNIADTNNYSPEFINPDEYVYAVNKFPILKGKLLSQVGSGPDVIVFDVDHSNITFSINGSSSAFEPVLVKTINAKWTQYVVDIKFKENIDKPIGFHLIAQDSGKPSRITATYINIISLNPLPKKQNDNKNTKTKSNKKVKVKKKLQIKKKSH